MAENDPLIDAMDEVTTAAEELKKLHLQIKQYADSSKRMNAVSDALLEISKSVKQIEEKFGSTLEKAELTQAAVASLLKSVPEVVRKIEASDAVRSITEFSTALTETKEIIASNKTIVDALNDSLHNDRKQNGKTIQDISEKVERQLNIIGQHSKLLELIRQVLTQNIATSVSDNTKVLAEIKTLIEGMGSKSTEAVNLSSIRLQKEIALLKGELESSKAISEKCYLLLEVMSKKKRFLF